VRTASTWRRKSITDLPIGATRSARDRPIESVFETAAVFRREKESDLSVVVVSSTRSTAQRRTILTRIMPYVIAALALGLSACANPYDPVQRAVGGGLIGAGSGAAIGAAAGGGPGAALGAAIGGTVGFLGGATSPPPPPAYGHYSYPAYGYPAYGYPGYAQPGYGYPGYSGYPAYSGPPGDQYQSRPLYSPYSDSGYGYPVAGYPGDRLSEDWSPGAEYTIEPAS
jgi:hypothetical protein